MHTTFNLHSNMNILKTKPSTVFESFTFFYESIIDIKMLDG